jgi:predicted ATPase
MTPLTKENYFILTGAMGAGKSTILNKLRELGLSCIDEPARQILAEQRNIQGDGLPEKNAKLFTDLLLSRSIHQFQQMQNNQGIVIFDRGIPDNIGYVNLFGLNNQVSNKAGQQYRYNQCVFFLPAWKEIYENDDERKMTFDEASQFGHDIKKTYESLGYQVTDVPIGSPPSRSEFIFNAIKRHNH